MQIIYINILGTTEYKVSSFENEKIIKGLSTFNHIKKTLEKEEDIKKIMLYSEEKIKFKTIEDEEIEKEIEVSDIVKEIFGNKYTENILQIESVGVFEAFTNNEFEDKYDKQIIKCFKQLEQDLKLKSIEEETKIVFNSSTGLRMLTTFIKMYLDYISIINENIQIEEVYYAYNSENKKLSYINITNTEKEIEIIEDLKEFKNNYNFTKRLTTEIGEIGDSNLRKRIKKIQEFHKYFQLANLKKIEEIILDIKNVGISGTKEESKLDLIESILKDIERFLVEFLGDDGKIKLEFFLDDLIEKEYYQLTITMLEGYIRSYTSGFLEFSYEFDNDQKIINYLKENKAEKLCLSKKSKENEEKLKKKLDDFINKAPNEFFKKSKKKEGLTEFGECWNEFKEIRNSINHGTGDIAKVKKKIKRAKKKGVEIIECFKEAKGTN